MMDGGHTCAASIVHDYKCEVILYHLTNPSNKTLSEISTYKQMVVSSGIKLSIKIGVGVANTCNSTYTAQHLD